MKKTLLFLKQKMLHLPAWWVFFVPHLVVLLAWWALYFPGIFLEDNIDQWRQLQTFEFNNWHPYLNTLWMWVWQLPTGSPWSVSLVQVFLVAALYASIFTVCLQQKVSRPTLGIFYVLLLFSIPVGMYTIMVGKDGMFSFALVGVAALLALKYGRPSWTRTEIALLVLLSVMAIFFRQNGFIYIVILPALVGYYFFRSRIAWLYPALLAPLFVVFGWVLPWVLDVQPAPKFLRYSPIYMETVSYYVNDYRFMQDIPRVTPRTKELLEQVLPREEFRANYDPRYWDYIFWNEHLNYDFFASDAFWDSFLQEFFVWNLPHNLNFFLGNRTTLFFTSMMGYANIIENRMYPNDLGLEHDPFLVPIEKFHWFNHNIVYQTIRKDGLLSHLLWNSFMPFVLLCMLCVHSFYKKYYGFQIFSVVLLIQAPFLFVLAPAGDWRYYSFYFFAFFVIVPIFLASKNKANSKG